MRKVAAGLALIWVLVGSAIEFSTYLPTDPEWTLLPTFALFGTSFLVGALGAFYMAPELTRIREWPTTSLPRWLLGLGVAWIIYTLVWFVALLLLPGQPTHCGTIGSPACGHSYVFNNHGTLTVTDRAGFLAGVRILVRVFASPPIAVLSLILVAYYRMSQHKSAPPARMGG